MIQKAVWLYGNCYAASACIAKLWISWKEGLYTETCSCVNVDGVMSDWFAVGSGVRQGCRIAPDLFLEPMDHMMERTVHRGMTGVTLGKEVFTDTLEYSL